LAMCLKNGTVQMCRQLSVAQLTTLFHFCIMDIRLRFGKKVKELRLSKGLSQESLALKANLDRTYIPSIEKGERNVSITVVEKIALALDVNIKDLF